MIYFLSDYSLGAHPEVLKALEETNMEHTDGYGHDHFSDECEALIQDMIGKKDAKVFFFVGGSQTNVMALSSMMKPYEGVITPRTGHIYVHECGGIELHGHRVFATDTKDGKLEPSEIDKTMLLLEDEHTVIPRIVYVTNPTENGGVYTKEELLALRKKCDEYNLIFYMDGARLGTALTWPGNDVTLKDIASIFDCFYIGGTKLGALFGEALVFSNPKVMDENFRFFVKRAGGHLAKGRLIAVQMKALLNGKENSLYYEIGRKENEIAIHLREEILKKGYKLWLPHETNQIFVIVDNKKIEELNKKFMFYTWCPYNETQSVIRLVTNWNTKEEEIEALLKEL